MSSKFLTDPDLMREYSGRFHSHANVVQDEANKAWASSQNIAGAGWSGQAQGTSSATMEEMMRAFRNINQMLQHTSDTLARNATEYETQEHQSSQILSS